jgi:hypothetical protein
MTELPRNGGRSANVFDAQQNPTSRGLVCGGQNLTKMFHVKHFCPVGAKNLTRPKTATRLRFGKIDRSFGAIATRAAAAPRSPYPLPEGILDVSFADGVEVATRIPSPAGMTLILCPSPDLRSADCPPSLAPPARAIDGRVKPRPRHWESQWVTIFESWY